MTVLQDDQAEAVQLLLSAYQTGVPTAPLAERFPGFDLQDAYRVQAAQVAAWVGDGRQVVGRKVGLTSAAMQAQLGVDQPDFGVMLADTAYADGAAIDVGSLLSPRVEPEIGFVLGSDLRGPGVTEHEAGQAVTEVRACLEIIDSRIADWRISLVDTVADNASYGAFVTGETIPWPASLDLAGVVGTMRRNGEVVASGTGAAVLGSPLRALAWLANTLGERGVGLEAGQVILPGSITAAVPVRAGDTVDAFFAGIGSVSTTFC